MRKQLTYQKDGKFYARFHLENGFEYCLGPFNSRSAAYRYAKAKSKEHISVYYPNQEKKQ